MSLKTFFFFFLRERERERVREEKRRRKRKQKHEGEKLTLFFSLQIIFSLFQVPLRRALLPLGALGPGARERDGLRGWFHGGRLVWRR